MVEIVPGTPCKKVRFEDFHSVTRIPSHHDFTPLECESTWYTKDEYQSFALNDMREKLFAPLEERKNKHQESLRIGNVRRTVLQFQSNRLLRNKLGQADNDYAEWLAEYIERHTEQSALEARQRGMENNLELLDMKMQEVKSRLKRHLPVARNQQVSKKTSYNKNDTKNARWSANEAKDVAPNAIRRNTGLRRELRKDLSRQ